MGDLSRHFSRGEFRCPCNCGFNTVDVELLIGYLEPLREQYGRVTVTSGCRCQAHNARVGGAPDSQHLYARAADVVCETGEPEEWAKFLTDIGAPGVGVYETHVHVDTRSGAPWRG